jgi:hypothetical protein
MSDHREEYKKWLHGKGNDPHPGKFSDEAADGWKGAGVDKYNDLLASIDAAVDAKTGARSSGQGGRVVQFPFAKWAAVAAAIAVLVLTTWLIYPKQSGSDELYATFFQLRTHPDAMVRGEESELALAEKSAVEAYVAKDFTNAIKQYEILVKLSPKEPKHVLFLAISYMNEGQTAKAISLLDGFSVSDNPYEADMRWYLALAHLKQGSLNTSKGLLENLAAGNSFYAESARELLSAMK